MAKNKLVLFVIIIILNIMIAAAQEGGELTSRPFRIGAGLGCSFTGYRDELESPINRYFNALTWILDGNIEKGNFFHSLNTYFCMGKPRMAVPYKGYSHKPYVSYRGHAEYALDYPLWGNRAFPGYLGGAFRTVLHYTGDDDQVDRTPPTGVALFSLDVHVSQKWLINEKNTLTFSAGYPVFGYAIRPAYAFADERWIKYLYEDQLKLITLGKIVSFHNYWAVFGDLKYQYTFNQLVAPYAGLGFELSRINFPRPKTDAIFRLNAGIAFTF